MKKTIKDVIEIEDYLTQQLDNKSEECARWRDARHMDGYSSLFKGASNEIKRLRKLLIDEKPEIDD